LKTGVPSKYFLRVPDRSLLQSPYFVSLKKPLEGCRLQMEVDAEQSAIGFSSRERHLEFQLHFPVLKMTV
jgi:hypothetical protein